MPDGFGEGIEVGFCFGGGTGVVTATGRGVGFFGLIVSGAALGDPEEAEVEVLCGALGAAVGFTEGRCAGFDAVGTGVVVVVDTVAARASL